ILRVAEVEFAGERLRRAVGGDLVMLDALRGGDQRGVLRGRVAVGLDDLFALGDQPLHRLADLAGGALAHLAEDLLQPVHVVARVPRFWTRSRCGSIVYLGSAADWKPARMTA